MNKTFTKGDVIIFKAENDWLSKAIAWFTQSDVCHAAMAYSEDSIVEMGARGISVDKVEISEGDNIFIMRLIPQADPGPLISAADAYIHAKVRYDFPELFILAGMIIYKHIIPTKDVLHISNKILTLCAFMLDEMIQHVFLHHTEAAMVCSELVYHIFYDCGDDYRIQVTDGCIWNGRLTEKTNGAIRLFDSLSPEKMNAEAFTRKLSLQQKEDAFSVPAPQETDLLAEKLYSALLRSETLPDKDEIFQNEEVKIKLSQTVSAAENFLSKLQYFLEAVKCDLPVEAMFITPGDLAYHSKNLKKQGSCSLKRI